MIDSEKVKKFWEERGKKQNKTAFESISNLEENPKLLQQKIDLEKKLVFSKLDLKTNQSILDLGAGVGQWAFRFSPHVSKITAVEYTLSQAKIAREEIKKRKIKNINYIISSAESFETDEKFDLIFISGLFVYLTDQQTNKVVSKIKNWIKPNGLIFIRDGTSILKERHQIKDKFSDILKVNYSAIYRTRSEYLNLFKKYRYIDDGQVFEEGINLNKYSETRLRYYLFKA